jgi:clan AA aspartic protease
LIVGEFRDRFPRIVLPLTFVDGVRDVEFILDTGFDGYLTLPSRIIQSLVAEPFSPQTHLLADGSEMQSLVYRLTISWEGELREVEALVLETNPLLGTLCLEGYHLDIEATEGGEVLIEPL